MGARSFQLTAAQTQALAHVTEWAKKRKATAQKAIAEVLEMSDVSYAVYEETTAKIKSHARVGLHFHPDRPLPDRRSVAEHLLEQGVYKSQFETSISSGSLSAYPGGDRDRWERQLFGGAYHTEGVTMGERPKYGALDLMLHPDGPAPRFGCCYFLLYPQVASRCTFTYLDSHLEPQERGTYEEFDDILAALLTEVFHRNDALGANNLTPRKLFAHLLTNLEKPFMDPAKRIPSRNLNHYIEAQIHGDLSLQTDVEILVADPSFRGTRVGNLLELLCGKYDIELYWHMGFVLDVHAVPTDFRGPTMPSLAQRIGKGGVVNARLLGEAAHDLMQTPDAWRDRGTYSQVLQEIKLLWHVLVRYGRPAS